MGILSIVLSLCMYYMILVQSEDSSPEDKYIDNYMKKLETYFAGNESSGLQERGYSDVQDGGNNEVESNYGSDMQQLREANYRTYVQCVMGICTPIVEPDFVPIPEDCLDLRVYGETLDGRYVVYPRILQGVPIQVYCDMHTSGGGWTYIQRRDENVGPRLEFFRGWDSYKYGFGHVDQEHWLGLINLRAMVASKDYRLRIELEDHEGKRRYAEYDYVYVGREESHYRLMLGTYTGDAGNGFSSSDGNKFSTKEKDNDASTENCAEKLHGAWWYNDCGNSSLNGLSHLGETTSHEDGIKWMTPEWQDSPFYSFRYSEMKIRPISRSAGGK